MTAMLVFKNPPKQFPTSTKWKISGFRKTKKEKIPRASIHQFAYTVITLNNVMITTNINYDKVVDISFFHLRSLRIIVRHVPPLVDGKVGQVDEDVGQLLIAQAKLFRGEPEAGS